MLDFLSKKENLQPIDRNFSLTLTSIKPENCIRSSRDIRYDKNIKRLYSSTKNIKSLQKQIQKTNPNSDTVQKLILLKNKGLQTVHTQQLIKMKNRLPYFIMMKQKIIKLTKQLFLELQIFKKIQSTVRRQKTVISKIYGWDQKFSNIFFNGQQIKAQIDFQLLEKSELIGKLNRNDSQLRSLLNKLKLFQAELKDFNIRQQDLNVQVKKKSIEESIDKFMSTVKKFQQSDCQNEQVLKRIRGYRPNRNKKSLKQILRIDNCKQELGLQKFQLKFGQDLDKLQSVIQFGYRKLNQIY